MRIKRLFGEKIDKTPIIVALILIAPIAIFVYQNSIYKNRVLSEKRAEKERNQEAFDTCISRAEYEFRRENRDKCWVYEHDAIDCDLTYWETYELGDTPQTEFKKSVVACEEKYPVANRLYSTTSPEFKSLLIPFGNLNEREAVRKIFELQEYKNFTSPPIEEGYKLRYDVESPSEETPYWLIHIFKESAGSEIITLNHYSVDAFTGEIAVK